MVVVVALMCLPTASQVTVGDHGLDGPRVPQATLPRPTRFPTRSPTASPTGRPSSSPPTASPTGRPSSSPTAACTRTPPVLDQVGPTGDAYTGRTNRRFRIQLCAQPELTAGQCVSTSRDREFAGMTAVVRWYYRAISSIRLRNDEPENFCQYTESDLMTVDQDQGVSALPVRLFSRLFS